MTRPRYAHWSSLELLLESPWACCKVPEESLLQCLKVGSDDSATEGMSLGFYKHQRNRCGPSQLLGELLLPGIIYFYGKQHINTSALFEGNTCCLT
jgi:hypothetical protein